MNVERSASLSLDAPQNWSVLIPLEVTTVRATKDTKKSIKNAKVMM